MTFLQSFFSSSSENPAEQEHAKALHKKVTAVYQDSLKPECREYESEYEVRLREAEADFKRAKLELKEHKDRQQMEALLRGIDTITQSTEFEESSERTKGAVVKVKSWVDYAAGMAEEHWVKERKQLEDKYGRSGVKSSEKVPFAVDEKKPIV